MLYHDDSEILVHGYCNECSISRGNKLSKYDVGSEAVGDIYMYFYSHINIYDYIYIYIYIYIYYSPTILKYLDSLQHYTFIHNNIQFKISFPWNTGYIMLYCPIMFSLYI